jgi:predicted permease
MRTFITDLAFAARRLRRARGVVILSLLSMALGVGLITAVATSIRTLTLQALPFPRPERLYLLSTIDPHGGEGAYSAQELKSLAESIGSMDVAGYDTRVFDSGEQGSVQGAAVTPNFFRVLGQPMALGSGFGNDAAPDTAVLSHDYWKSAFGGDASIIGRVIHLDGAAYVVRGVLGPGLPFPRRARIWKLLEPAAAAAGVGVVARLRPGQSVAQAKLDVRRASDAILAARPVDGQRLTSRMVAMPDEILGRRRAAMRLIRIAGWIVFLIACLNVSGLLLARHASREGELAMRLALGANWRHIWRLLVCEGLLLTFAGGIAGSLLALTIVPALLTWTAGNMGVGAAPERIGAIFLFAFSMAAIGALIVSVPPFLRAIVVSPASVLSRHNAHISGPSRIGRWLVAVQMGAAVMLLVPAAALTRSVRNLETVTAGFDPRGVLVVRVILPASRYKEEDLPGAFRQILDGVRGQGDVKAAGLTQVLPLTGWNPGAALTLEDTAAGAEPRVDIQRVTPGYFDAMGIPFRSGTAFGETDVTPAFQVAVVNEAFVRRFMHSGNALGRRLRVTADGKQTNWLTVVGVVGDVREYGLNVEPKPEVFVPQWSRAMSLVVRTGSPAAAAPRLRAILPSLNLSLRNADVRSMEEIVRDSTMPAKVMGLLCAVLGAVALILGGVGVYGIAAQSVEQRMVEIGIRRALGASGRAIVRLIAGDLALPLAAAAVAGLLIGSGTAGTLRSLLYQVAPYDLRNGIVAVAALAVMVLITAVFPLRSALQVDPARVLHTE